MTSAHPRWCSMRTIESHNDELITYDLKFTNLAIIGY